MRDFSKETATAEKFDFSINDIDFETDILMPRISLSKNIKVLGDYFSYINQEPSVKSTFRMFIDYEEVIKSAFAAAKKDVKRADSITKCVADSSRAPFNEKGLREAAESVRDKKLEEWNAQFDVYDRDYFAQREIFLEELEAE